MGRGVRDGSKLKGPYRHCVPSHSGSKGLLFLKLPRFRLALSHHSFLKRCVTVQLPSETTVPLPSSVLPKFSLEFPVFLRKFRILRHPKYAQVLPVKTCQNSFHFFVRVVAKFFIINLRVTGMPSLFYLRLADDPSLMLRQVSPLVLGWGSYGSLCGFSWRSGWGQI